MISSRIRCLFAILLFLSLAPARSSAAAAADSDWEESRRRIAFALQPSFVLTEGPEPVEVRHTPQDIAQTRKLLQSTGSLPRCEMNVGYTVVETTPDNFTAAITLANNRELGSNMWQLVFHFAEYRAIKLANVSGATTLTQGSTSGSAVRIVDMFTLDASKSGIPAGGNYTFAVTAGFMAPPTTGKESLLMQNVNLNGLACSQVEPAAATERLEVAPCNDALSFFSAFSGGTTAVPGLANDACRASYCCGFISSPPPPPPSPLLLPPGKEPDPAPLLPLPTEDFNDGSTPSPEPEKGAGELEQPPPPPLSPRSGKEEGDALDPEPGDGGVIQKPQNTGGNDKLTPLLGGVVGAAVLLAIAVVTTGWVLRRRWRTINSAENSDQKPGKKVAGGLETQGSVKSGSPVTATVTSPTKVRSLNSTASTLAAALTPGSRSMLTMQKSQEGSCTLRSCTNSGEAGSPGGQGFPQEVTLFEQLGSGAFGTVYRGQWAGKAVAVKVLQTACTSSSKELASFQQEVAVLSRLRHPNIISFFAACTVPPDICIIEELAEAGSLHARLHGTRENRRHTPLPLPELLAVAADIAEAMAYLHHGIPGTNIVHRDLKPQNVLLDSAGRAKVCDFGVAKFKERTFVSTANGQAGTPNYMAPELFDGGRVTEKVDVYSFAILLWEMMTAMVPWGSVPSPMQVIYVVGVLQQRPPLPENTPAKLKSLIQECWREVPKQRPSFKEILQRLREMQAGGAGAREEERVAEGSDGNETGTAGACAAMEDTQPSSFSDHVLHSYDSSGAPTTASQGVARD